MVDVINNWVLDYFNKLGDENLNLIVAAESGSRIWGTQVPSSDYDVRIIFRPRDEEYIKASVDAGKRVIEHNDMWNDTKVDIVAFDLKKALKLLMKGNPNMFEWIHSPIQYTTPHPELVKYSTFISPLPKMQRAYLGMAWGGHREFIKKGRIKSALQAIRCGYLVMYINEYKDHPHWFDLNHVSRFLHSDHKDFDNALVFCKNIGYNEVVDDPFSTPLADVGNYLEKVNDLLIDDIWSTKRDVSEYRANHIMKVTSW